MELAYAKITFCYLPEITIPLGRVGWVSRAGLVFYLATLSPQTHRGAQKSLVS